MDMPMQLHARGVDASETCLAFFRYKSSTLHGCDATIRCRCCEIGKCYIAVHRSVTNADAVSSNPTCASGRPPKLRDAYQQTKRLQGVARPHPPIHPRNWHLSHATERTYMQAQCKRIQASNRKNAEAAILLESITVAIARPSPEPVYLLYN